MNLFKSLFIGIMAGAFTFSAAFAEDYSNWENIDRSSSKKMFRHFNAKEFINSDKNCELPGVDCPEIKKNEMNGLHEKCSGCFQMRGDQMMYDKEMRPMRPMMPRHLPGYPMMPPPRCEDMPSMPMGPMHGPMNHHNMRHIMMPPPPPMMMFMTPGDHGFTGKLDPAKKEEFVKKIIAHIKLEMELTPEFKEHMLKNLDINKDGALSDEEIKIALENHGKMKMNVKEPDQNKRHEHKKCPDCNN